MITYFIDYCFYFILLVCNSLECFGGVVCLFVCVFVFGATALQWARAHSFTMFLDHTQRRTTVGRFPLDE
jgi:hypothetical protein